MVDREKVIKGLEAILEETADMFYRSTVQDAIALLKAQEPRLMTLEEAQKSLMIEYRSGKTWNVGAELFGEFGYAYNIIWRVWTSRPDDETREATLWLT